MRLSKAWTVASKDFRIFTKKKYILYSIIGFEVFVSIGLPLIILFASNKPTGLAILPDLITSFSFWFIIGASLLPVGIASYSLVGEKVQKSLEPLFATPTTDMEILTGKALAAFIPALIANFIGAILFMFFIDLFTASKLNALFYPNGAIAILMFVLEPLVCILSIGYNILISSRTSDIRAAQQLGTLIMLPMGAIYVLSEINVLQLTISNLLIMSLVFLIIDVIVFYLAKATFQREEILTKWK
jgi:ABC-2 type transport system permease protein